MKTTLRALLILAGVLAPGAVRAYEVRYEARILPDRGTASLSIAVVQNRGEVRELSFAIEPERYFDETADGELVNEGTVEAEAGAEADGEGAVVEPRLTWRPPRSGGVLRYSMRVDRIREDAEYDARCASSWMLARAEDFFPPMSVRYTSGSEMTRSTLRFKLPPRWKVVHPFEIRDGLAVIDQPHRKFDQPKGWILAGHLSRHEVEIEGSRIVLAAPRGHGARLEDTLAFLRWTLPEMNRALGSLPRRISIVLAGDPMWRGGLSAPGSAYLHADRPLIEGDFSSPLLHELVHTATRARSAPGEDWIVEGLAEFYSREILRRTGSISQQAYDDSLASLRRRGEGVRRMKGEATGAETALAVAFFHDLDVQIREASQDAKSLDDVVATLVGDVGTVDRAELEERIHAATGFSATRLIQARIRGSAE